MEFLVPIFNFFFTTYIGGILFIVYGILYIVSQIKKKQKYNEWWYLRGWASGIGSLILGIFIILAKLMNIL